MAKSTQTYQPPGRLKNSDYRSREHLTIEEIELLLEAADSYGRHQVRNRLMILLGFRHGLRREEISLLRWDAIDWSNQQISIQRVKGSESGIHPLQADEIALLRRLQQVEKYEENGFVFVGERGERLGAIGVSQTLKRIAAACDPKLPLLFHAHMLRHSCGFWLANQGYDTRLIQDWLGHRNIEHTVRYTRLSPERFKVIRWE
ncbi:MAG: tyrosine-type recombinase/integrase [Synechococcales cyanobacterium T60_A2020_003]|nr:tyrosine-type recombinase/integrase [Synechococcales cyanobacterium T60_A2020_003]